MYIAAAPLRASERRRVDTFSPAATSSLRTSLSPRSSGSSTSRSRPRCVVSPRLSRFSTTRSRLSGYLSPDHRRTTMSRSSFSSSSAPSSGASPSRALLSSSSSWADVHVHLPAKAPSSPTRSPSSPPRPRSTRPRLRLRARSTRTPTNRWMRTFCRIRSVSMTRP